MSPQGLLCTQPGLPSHIHVWGPQYLWQAGSLSFFFRVSADFSSLYYSQCFLSQAGYKEITLSLDLFIILLFSLADTIGAFPIPSCLDSQLGSLQAWQCHFPP